MISGHYLRAVYSRSGEKMVELRLDYEPFSSLSPDSDGDVIVEKTRPTKVAIPCHTNPETTQALGIVALPTLESKNHSSSPEANEVGKSTPASLYSNNKYWRQSACFTYL